MTTWVEEDGYPSEAALERIRTWSIRTADDIEALFRFVAEVWHWEDGCQIGPAREVLRPEELEVAHVEPDERVMRLATGGWSGNESVVGALKANPVARLVTWKLSTASGLHIFRVYVGRRQ